MTGIAEPAPAASELALARAWADGEFPNRLPTRDGTEVEIVYRGVWTHGLGPDFSQAMIAWPDGRLETGSIELHLRTTGWRDHGHHQDPAYNAVVLHVVGIDDGAETRRSDGKLVPTVTVGLEKALVPGEGPDWSRVGGEVCAADLAVSRPGLIVQALHGLGDARLAALTAVFEADLALLPPDQVLWTGLLDAFGISENREPMRKLATLLPIADLERALARAGDRFLTAARLLLDVAGFLPFAPRDAETSGLSLDQISAIEAGWRNNPRPVGERLSPREWQLTRVRPSNHPVVRLVTAAALAAHATGGLSSALLDRLRSGSFESSVLMEMAERSGAKLGADRAIVIASRVLIPFALALSEQTGDAELADSAMSAWDALAPSGHNRLTRAAQLQITGGPPIRNLGERGMQGLLHLHRTRCVPRRCFECPIAALVVSER